MEKQTSPKVVAGIVGSVMSQRRIMAFAPHAVWRPPPLGLVFLFWVWYGQFPFDANPQAAKALLA
jgi:hypothetical protein